MIALCIAVGLAGAAAASFLAKPLYKASAVLSVEKDRGGPAEIGPIDSSAGSYDPDFLPTQMRLIRSREVAERVARQLNLADTTDTASNAKSGFFRPADKDAASKNALTMAALWVQGATEVQPIRGTTLVEVSCLAKTPRQAAEIANAVADAYVGWSVENRFRALDETSQFLSSQIQQLRVDIDAKEKQLLAYGRQKDIVASEPTTNSTMQNLQTLNADFASAVAERVAKEARYNEIKNAPPEAVVDLIGSSSVAQLRNEQARVEREYAEKLNIYKPDWPAMQSLKIQIDKGRQHLDSVMRDTVAQARETAKAEYQTALRREASMKGVLGAQKSEAMNVNTNAVEYNSLKIAIDTKKALLDSLVKRQGETEIMSRLRSERLSSIRIVDRALPPGSRFSPSYRKNGITGVLAGSVIGVGLAFFLSYLDRSLRNTKDVERYLQIPALGTIPAVGPGAAKAKGSGYGRRAAKNKSQTEGEQAPVELLPHRQSRSRVAERYRAFRTSLLLSQAGGVKSVVVTSAFSREGKTVTAVNLAVVLAQLGKRVLLVDADLHRPRLHEIFRTSNRTGLVSILAENVRPESAVTQTEVPDLFLIASGPLTPNPSGLLSSEAMSNFLELARMNYDYVVLDGPPILPVADSLVVGHQTDGAVVCIRAGETPRDDIATACEKLRRSGVRILGALINNLAEDVDGYTTEYAYETDYYASESGRTEEAGGSVVPSRRLI